jgi:hypothetical protein
MSDCPSGLQTVSFTFRADDVTDPVGDRDLQNLNVYIFDENDNYIRSVQIKNPDLGTPYTEDDQGEPIALNPGKYNFVVWSNISSNAKDETMYHVIKVDEQNNPLPKTKNIVSIDTTKMRESRDGRKRLGVVNEGMLSRLFFKDMNNASVVETGSNDFVFYLYENTNLFDIKVVGLPRDNDNYIFVIEDSNGKYSFSNDFGENDYNVLYEATSRFTAVSDTLNAQLRVLKLDPRRTYPPELYIFRGSISGASQLFEGNVIDLILKANPNVNFEKTHRYEILIEYQANGIITVTINGWKVIEINNDIVPN